MRKPVGIGLRNFSKFKYIDEELSGYLSCIKIESVRNKHDKREICLADDGYIWFAFMPDNQNWSMTEMIDDKGNIIEWYGLIRTIPHATQSIIDATQDDVE